MCATKEAVVWVLLNLLPLILNFLVKQRGIKQYFKITCNLVSFSTHHFKVISKIAFLLMQSSLAPIVISFPFEIVIIWL